MREKRSKSCREILADVFYLEPIEDEIVLHRFIDHRRVQLGYFYVVLAVQQTLVLVMTYLLSKEVNTDEYLTRYVFPQTHFTQETPE